MFSKNKKGQSALEYLMTYGWALVVIVIVVAALVFLINPSQVGGQSCTGFQNMPIGNFQLGSTGLTYKATNQTGRALSAVAFGGKFTNAGTTTYVNSEFPDIVTIAANAEQSVTLPATLTAGSATIDLNVSYFDGDFTRSAKATCKGTVA